MLTRHPPSRAAFSGEQGFHYDFLGTTGARGQPAAETRLLPSKCTVSRSGNGGSIPSLSPPQPNQLPRPEIPA